MAKTATFAALRRLVHDATAPLDAIKALIDAPGVDLSLRATSKEFLQAGDKESLVPERKRVLDVLEKMKYEPKSGLHKDNLLGWSAAVGRLDVLTLLTQPPYNQNPHENNQNALFKASITNQIPVIEYLVKLPGFRPDLLRHDELVVSPLTEAAYASNLGAVKALLAAGCSAKVGDDMAILRASGSRNPSTEIVKLLLENGADVNSACEDPLRIAIENEDLAMIGLLVDFGASVIDVVEEIYARDSRMEIVKLILEKTGEFPLDEDTPEDIREYVEAYDA
ncbi:hypothetical protein HDU96_000690 [Phlyctochytrium bullatum]|nr:hypothetical protein HDU96_000690 [Phlyctochytrium bullatum]